MSHCWIQAFSMGVPPCSKCQCSSHLWSYSLSPYIVLNIICSHIPGTRRQPHPFLLSDLHGFLSVSQTRTSHQRLIHPLSISHSHRPCEMLLSQDSLPPLPISALICPSLILLQYASCCLLPFPQHITFHLQKGLSQASPGIS